MKKFLAIFTIVAMLSGMCTIGASAATDALSATIELVEGEANVFTAEAGTYTTSFSFVPSAENFVGLVNDYSGPCGATGYNNGSNEWWTSSGVIKKEATRGFALRVPGFFKDKPAGQYKINLVCGSTNNDGANPANALTYKILDVGATVNNGDDTYSYTGNAFVGGEKPSWNDNNVELVFDYNGITEITTDDADKYDPYALCVVFRTSTQNALYYVSGLTATSPKGDSYVKATNTISDGQDGVLINALYDAEGNLLTVDTKDITTEDATAELKLGYTGDFSSDWSFKGFIWKDLDSTIEPLAETAEADFTALAPYVFTEDFENFDYTGAPTYSYSPTSETFVGLAANTYEGVHKGADCGGNWYGGADINVGWDIANRGLQTRAFCLSIPEFFKGKEAGTYTIQFDYYDRSEDTTANNNYLMQMAVLDVVGSINSGTTTWARALSNASEAGTGKQKRTAKIELTWNGNTTITNPDVNANDYDPYKLCLHFQRAMFNPSHTQFTIDNIVITSPDSNVTSISTR